MAFVYLNSVRANIATTPEASEYTGINERIKLKFNPRPAAQEQIEHQNLLRFTIDAKPLARFEGNDKNGANPNNLPQYWNTWVSVWKHG